MDFDDFDDGRQDLAQVAAIIAESNAQKALNVFDHAWYIRRSRASRRMDLLGDYAGNEFFLIDGESLFQLVLDDPLLALGQENDPSFQILHAYHTLERILSEYTTRAANFQIVFFHVNRHLTLQTGDSPFIVASRMLARTLLFKHLLKLGLPVHTFRSLIDHRWEEYRNDKKPMFILINDGSISTSSKHSPNRVLGQRKFIYDLLRGSLAVALLRGTSYADSKIVTFVYEPERQGSGGVFPGSFITFLGQVQVQLDSRLDEDMGKPAHELAVPSTTLPPDTGFEVMERNFINTLWNSLTRVSDLFLLLTLIHFYHLPTLSVAERSQPTIQLPLTISQTLCDDLLTPFFSRATHFLSLSDARLPFDFDGRAFVSTAILVIREVDAASDLQEALGLELYTRVQKVCNGLEGRVGMGTILLDELARTQRVLSSLEWSSDVAPLPAWASELLQVANVKKATAEKMSSSVVGSQGSNIRLLSFDNPVWSPHLPSISAHAPSSSATANGPRRGSTGPTSAFLHFGSVEGTMFSDTQHWHNQKSILPAHLGGLKEKPANSWLAMKRLRKNQRFMFNLQMQAATITGASGSALRQLVIPSVKTSSPSAVKAIKGSSPADKCDGAATHAKPTKKKEKPVKLSSKQLLLQKIQDQKQAEANDSSRAWWKSKLAQLEKMNIDVQAQELANLLRNKRAEEELLKIEMLSYQLQLQVALWIHDPEPSSPESQDRFSLAIMRLIKQLVDGKTLTTSLKDIISTLLSFFGFQEYTESMFKDVRVLEGVSPSFKFKKLVKSKTGVPVYDFMVLKGDPVRWQLRLFGEYMDRSMDSAPDPRVPFHPDAWQRKVLDCIDANHSMLVVAPTSAGKTFISFYAMEQTLRASDDDILVYVAPTKALVTQIAAEIYARFSKKMDGKSCWAIHTRDHRINDPQKCQILVTVPEILAIMLLSPPLANVWTPKIKRIILDEIHSIGHQEGGAVWEQILLLASCPIVGLSATIGSPETFNDWLATVQKSHGFQHTFISHPHRYSHLRKFFYVLDDEPGPFVSLSKHESTARTRFLHPITALSFGRADLPDDLALEARDTLSLYEALETVGPKAGWDFSSLDPSVFFAGKKEFLRQKDILEYEAKLKAVLVESPPKHGGGGRGRKSKSQSSLILDVVSQLEDPVLKKLGLNLDKAPDRKLFEENLIRLVADLHVQNELPAIFFNFDRTGCEVIALKLLEALEDAENQYKETSPAWKRKVAQWEAWKANAKERERQAAASERQKKNRVVDPDDLREPPAATWSWEESFDPDQPLQDFSFIDYKSSYSLSELEEEIRELTRGGRVKEKEFALLRRGIGVHHAGMNKGYRSLIEALFRRGFLRVIIATGTLALGINAPAKTSVFISDSPYLTALQYRQCAGRAGRRGYDLLGNVVFYGLPMDRVHRLILSKLPVLGGGFPLTSTLVLRLCNLLEESNRAPNVVKAINALMTLPRVSFTSDVGRDYLVHHVRFSIEYLRRTGLLNEAGKPMNLFAIAGHLYYTEPSNLALVGLLRSGILHTICRKVPPKAEDTDAKVEEAKRTYILLMAHLFGRRYLPISLSENQERLKDLTSRYPSKIVLPAMPRYALKVLKAQAADILEIFVGYSRAYAESSAQAEEAAGRVPELPLSGAWASRSDNRDATTTASPLTQHLRASQIETVIRSPFVANSGLCDDDFRTVQELAETVRTDIHLNPHAIPCLDDIISSADVPHERTPSAPIVVSIHKAVIPEGQSKRKKNKKGKKEQAEKVEEQQEKQEQSQISKRKAKKEMKEAKKTEEEKDHVPKNASKNGQYGQVREQAPPLKLNAYLYDFYIHGQVNTIIVANGIRKGDSWYLLEDFRLTLLTVKAALEQLLVKASLAARSSATGGARAGRASGLKTRKTRATKDGWDDTSSEENSDFDDVELDGTLVESRDETLLDLDMNEIDEVDFDGADGKHPNGNMEFKRPAGVTGQDWLVYRVVSLACAEFDVKSRAMWA
ncbi:hypothetical protein EST38_g7225 [Candolleomyces aberdarensis]|uniref:P-loop containing nucleoside triphosphate hydrolase protein n=1 Tax=Candolleomyces aberdarensis TaxID=2316362 RepID=A0A4Q2DG53_9AGAR|nr:hypothetical protein EST38_g7225 [Candolleomyces aberdarensis]